LTADFDWSIHTSCLLSSLRKMKNNHLNNFIKKMIIKSHFYVSHTCSGHPEEVPAYLVSTICLCKVQISQL
jgi:hypothetical protein